MDLIEGIQQLNWYSETLFYFWLQRTKPCLLAYSQKITASNFKLEKFCHHQILTVWSILNFFWNVPLGKPSSEKISFCLEKVQRSCPNPNFLRNLLLLFVFGNFSCAQIQTFWGTFLLLEFGIFLERGGTCVCGSTEPRSSPNSKILWYKFLSKYSFYNNDKFYHIFIAMALLKSVPQFKVGAPGGPWEAPQA